MWGRGLITVLVVLLLLAACGPEESEAPAASATQAQAQARVVAPEAVEGCPVILGEWRDERPYWVNTTRICQLENGDRIVHVTFDRDGSVGETPLDSEGATGRSSGDRYTINEDGTLTISDHEGPIVTLKPL